MVSVDQLRLIPEDAATLRALAQQVLCWARRNGRPDTRIKIATAPMTHVVVPPGVCQEYDAPPFTAEGQPIACPVAGEGQQTYDVVATDVVPLNIADCSILGGLRAPGGLVAQPVTATSAQLSWQAPVPGADGFRITVWPTDDPSPVHEVFDLAAPPVELGGLAPVTRYTVQVVAVDSTGTHPDSPPSEVTFTTAAALWGRVAARTGGGPPPALLAAERDLSALQWVW